MRKCHRCGAGNYALICTECGTGLGGYRPRPPGDRGIHWRYVKGKGSQIKLARHRAIRLPRIGGKARVGTRQPQGFRLTHG